MGRWHQVVQFQTAVALFLFPAFILFYNFGQIHWSHSNNHPSFLLCPWKLSRWPTTLNPLQRYTSVCNQNTSSLNGCHHLPAKTWSSFGLTSLISRLTFKAAERKVMSVELSKLSLLHTRVLELRHNSLQEQLFLGGQVPANATRTSRKAVFFYITQTHQPLGTAVPQWTEEDSLFLHNSFST